MIVDYIWFVLFSFLVVHIILALPWKIPKTILWYLGLPGVPFHELSHLVACLFARVKITEVVLLEVKSPLNAGGHINTENNLSPFAGFFIGMAPLFGGVLWAYSIGEIYIWAFEEFQFDPGWHVITFLLIFSIVLSSPPSSTDLNSMFSSMGRQKLQSCSMVLGLLGGLLLTWWIEIPWQGLFAIWGNTSIIILCGFTTYRLSKLAGNKP